MTVYLFHCTEGSPHTYWYPWLKEKLEAAGHHVVARQFTTLPSVSAKLDERLSVLTDSGEYIDEKAIFFGHSLGGLEEVGTR